MDVAINGQSSGTNAIYDSIANQNTPVDTKPEEKTNVAVPAAEEKDVYEKTGKKGYKPYKMDKATVNKMLEEANKKALEFRKMIEKSMMKQGETSSIANLNTLLKSFYNSSSNETGIAAKIKALNPDQETIDKAKADIAEGGYWSAEVTGQRILDFAKALSGGDPKRLAEMEAAFEKGFKRAASMWGEDLPQISKDTYDYVKKGFADMKKSTDETTASPTGLLNA